jgi:hypothetical protein
MEHWIYKIIHLMGLVGTMMALGAAAVHSKNGGTRQDNPSRKLLAATHGTGLFLMLLGGFGMLARMGIVSAWPGWVWAKLALWLLLGALLSVPFRMPKAAKVMWFLLPLLTGLGAFIALRKPF